MYDGRQAHKTQMDWSMSHIGKKTIKIEAKRKCVSLILYTKIHIHSHNHTHKYTHTHTHTHKYTHLFSLEQIWHSFSYSS